MIRFKKKNQPISYINFSTDLLLCHIIRLVNMVREDSIMLRFQAVEKVHPEQFAKMETVSSARGLCCWEAVLHIALRGKQGPAPTKYPIPIPCSTLSVLI